MEKSKIVKYDNTFNKTSLSLLTKVQADVLLSVLAQMGKDSTEEDCYVATFTFKEVRQMIGAEHMQLYRIKQVFDTLLDTKVEFFTDDTYEKGNLFSHYSITGTKEARIVLTRNLTDKLITNSKEYTILNLNEYIELPNGYAKELYRILRQFRHSGMRLIAKEELINMMKPPKSYNEYDFVRKVLLPAIEENKAYFKNLTVNVGDKNNLPRTVRFMFMPQDKHESFQSKTEREVNADLLEYVKANANKKDDETKQWIIRVVNHGNSFLWS